MNTALEIQRTPELIAAEINNIKAQTRTMLLYNSIEIGRRLVEAKQFIPHGEWGKWLETSVEYSQSTANNLMRIFTEYGADQIALFGETGTKSQAFGKLSYTQAVALLGVPEEEREQFIEENDIENMSTRELQKVIKERDQARREKEEAEKTAAEKTQELNDLQDILEQERFESEEKIKKLESSISEIEKQLKEAQAAGNEEEIKRLKLELAEADNQLLDANKEIADLNEELKKKPIETTVADIVEKIPDEVQKELEELRKVKQNEAIIKFSVCFEELTDNFKKLLATLREIPEEERPKYTGAVTKLINMMGERL